MKRVHSYGQIPQGKPLYIYGAGGAGKKIFEDIGKYTNIKVEGFLDTFARGEIGGLPILDPAGHVEELKDAVILIASQEWAQIQQKLHSLGLTDAYNAYPLYLAPSPNSARIDHGFGAPAVFDALVERIACSPETARFAVVGLDGSAADLVAALRGSAVASRIVRHFDTSAPAEEGFAFSTDHMLGHYMEKRYDTVILAVGAQSFRRAIRLVRFIHGIDAPLWVPKERTDRTRLPGRAGTPLGAHLIEVREELTERSGIPLIVVVPPCAGTNRFEPPMESLLNLLGWTSRSFMALTRNPYFYGRFRDPQRRTLYADPEKMIRCYVEENTVAYTGFARSLQYFEYMALHDHSIDLRQFADLPCRMVVLMRDPRDVINSYFHRIDDQWEGRRREQEMLALLDGRFGGTEPGLHYRWAGAREWTDSYLAALESPNMEVVRFEDLHRDEVGTLRDILHRLDLCPNPFVEVSDDTLRTAAHLGSFEYQTGGLAKRGEERGKSVGQTSCRKGAVGDWRSTFTPAVVEKFKRLTGDALIRLGYEDSMDWGLDLPEPS